MSRKYLNQPVESGGKKFDSKREKARYHELLLLERAGEISNLQHQVPFVLLDTFKHHGETVRGIKYIADFVYEQDGQKIAEDLKGGKATQTQAFIIKFKWAKAIYGKDYKFIISE